MPLATASRKRSFLNLFTPSTEFPPPDQDPPETHPPAARPSLADEQDVPLVLPRSRRTSISLATQPSSASRPLSVHSLSFRPQSQQGVKPKQPDFARLRVRHASDPQLSTRYREQQPDVEDVDSVPPSPTAAPAPVIGYAATRDAPVRRSFNPFSSRSKSYNQKVRESTSSNVSNNRKSSSTPSAGQSRRTSATLERVPTTSNPNDVVTDHARPQSSPSIKIEPPPRQSTSSTTSRSFFGISRRKRHADEPLFPLPPKLGPPPVQFGQPAQEFPSRSPAASQDNGSKSQASSIRSSPQRTLAGDNQPFGIPATHGALPPMPTSLAAPRAGLLRTDSSTSAPTSPVMRIRDRSRTSASINSRFEEDSINGNMIPSGRNSTASASVGRNSIAGLRSITSRLRHGSEPMSPRYGSGAGLSSHTNSFALSRDNLALPEREDGESAGKYFSRIEQTIPKKSMALLLAKSKDVFNNDVLRSLLRTFMFYEEPLDVSLRKFLWEIDIRGEAQVIERIIEAFAERYHECNPHIFDSADQVSFIAFSLVILHSDLFNKNNKRKMQRHEYQKNSGGHGVDEEILGYLYDNIIFTEFITQDNNEDDSESKALAKLRKQRNRARNGSTADIRMTGSDPYEFIIDPELRLDVLRPALKNVLNLEDTYHYLAPNGHIDVVKIRESFAKPGILRLISSRSRPEAYASQFAPNNQLEAATQGVVEISVVKIGIIWRKDVKKRKTQRTWQVWIAMLTQSKIYFFRNTGWIRMLLEKWEMHEKHPDRRLIYTPQIEDFKPDMSVLTVNAVALFDRSYDKHKNAFVLSRPEEAFEEVLLADDAADLNDWIAKINFASTFTTAHIAVKPAQRATMSPAKRRPSVDPFLDEEVVYDPQIIDQQNAQRQEAMIARKTIADEGIAKAKVKLEEQLRNARHLQILAPFPPKTRSELLAFGARISHRIRWARYEIWRLQCHKDILSLVASFEESGQQEASNVITIHKDSPRLTAKAFGLGRLNSRGSLFATSPKSGKQGRESPRLSMRSSLGRTQDHNLLSTDQLSQRPLSSSGSVSTDAATHRLPSLLLEPGNMDGARRLSGISDGPTSSFGGDLIRKVSTISTLSQNNMADIEGTGGIPHTPIQGPTSGIGSEEVATAFKNPPADVLRPERSQELDHRKEHNAFGSPDSARTSVRRSLRETLRDSKDIPRHASRARITKASISGSVPEDPLVPLTDKSGISRREGSFRVHGKKASVITLPNDFTHMSPEDRLRARKAVREEDEQSIIPSSFDGAQTASRSSMSDFDSSGTFGTAGTSFYRASADSHRSVRSLDDPDTPYGPSKDKPLDTLPLDLAASKVAPTTEAGKRLYEAINREIEKENSNSFDDSSTTATPRPKVDQTARLASVESDITQSEEGTFLESASESSSWAG